ncbi:hypothetical protein [Microbacterium sp. nov. GSS16]|uniref:hypothetical protein n=1 Tax=Microbacterium sp. nov. GSS16 TaxID=3019890 RepID=UPI00230582F2|nr:hypothetical protein [Microbacterium sp. nov. GSS16]WCD93332.1 hypothetical protein PGB26_03350 [Microbacterium sp. nov. GSS16]
MFSTSLQAHLERARTRHGCALTPDDFVFFRVDGRLGWRVASTVAGAEDVLYEIWDTDGHRRDSPDTAAMQGSIRVDGRETPLPHPYRRSLRRKAALQDWYDAILFEEAQREASARSVRRWGQDELSSMVKRSSLGISAYGAHEVAVDSFPTVSALQAWIDEALSGTRVRVIALVLADYPYFRDEMRDGQLLQKMDGDEAVAYLPIVVATNQDSAVALAEREGHLPPRPSATVRMSGGTRIRWWADAVLSWSAVARNSTLSRDGDARPAAGDWVLLGVEGTDIALPVPWGSSNLLIETDDDGALVEISAPSTARREQHHRRRAEFEDRWGRWLDEEQNLTREELEAGIRRAEAGLRAVLAIEED